MTKKPLHIISFDTPFPSDYGGVIDVFYKLKKLNELGFIIYLHCFYQERNEVFEELSKLTEKVFLYKKNRNPFYLFSAFPLSVKSRFSKELAANIQLADAPILFEGLQTTMLLYEIDCKLPKYLRLHNLESKFYSGICRSETNWFKKMMYFIEALKYKKYEQKLSGFDRVFTLSIFETQAVASWTNQVTYLPVFHGNEGVKVLSQFGDYALYHGDLRLPDNKKATRFLIEVFKKIPDFKLVIASSNGEDFVGKYIGKANNITFKKISDSSTLDKLLEQAHINVMLSFQQSGTKLKLINSLYKSRFCLINENMIDDQNIINLCALARTKEDFIAKINELKTTPYELNEQREKVLSVVLNDSVNAQKLASYLNKP